jgi:hypothetical protein
MIVARTKVKPFLLSMMLRVNAIQQRLAPTIFLCCLYILLLSVFGVGVVSHTVTNAPGGAVLFARLVTVLEVFAAIGANVIAVLFLPSALVFAVLILATQSPRAAALGTPRIAPVFVSNVNRK